ncbi:glycosyltransferase family 2 protein [Formosa sp. L2A11]|uniref:glycosyltransferase family 2 protein n=1 Tax=Formosa sp. L2A11 TaxID=2686363 RepID=UPI00131BD8ED|nr:glycosyltransferase family 2 protein [Formosa sp. L2A11]
MKPYFSIIIPLYNKQNHIKHTINTVINQSFKDFEIIVVNDGSTDKSQDIVSNINESRISIFTIKNQGVSFARNFGVKKTTSDRIVFLDADDSWETNHLETLFNLYQEYPSCGLYCTAYQKKIKHKIIPSTYNSIPKITDWSGIIPDFFEASFINCIAWTSAVSIPKRAFIAVHGFDESITLGAGEDTDLWIKLAINYPVAFTNTVTATHNLYAENRISNSSTSLRNFINLDNYEAAARDNKSLKKYIDLNRFALALKYKVDRNELKFKEHQSKIDFKNLNWKQKLILKCNRTLLITAKNIQVFLQQSNLFLSSFK